MKQDNSVLQNSSEEKTNIKTKKKTSPLKNNTSKNASSSQQSTKKAKPENNIKTKKTSQAKTKPGKVKVAKDEQLNDVKNENSVNLNELNIKVTNLNLGTELINENGATVVTLLMQNDGKVFISFLGDYNKNILLNLKGINNKYYKQLIKKLYGKKKDKNSNHEDIVK